MNEPEGMENSLTLSVEELDCPSTIEGILTVLRRVLSKPYVQSISVKADHPIEVTWYRDITDTLSIGEPEESPDTVLGRIDLEEFSSTKSAREALVDAVLSLNQQGLQATHLFVGSVGFFKSWVELPSVLTLPKFEGTDYYNFIGLKTLETDSLEEDVVVLLGAGSLSSTQTELVKALKIVT
jgi:hypothetical protein